LTSEAMGLANIRCRAGVDDAQALALGAALARGSLHPLSRALAAAGPAETKAVSQSRELAGLGVEAAVGDQQLRLGSASFCSAPRSHDTASGPQVHLADAMGWLASFHFDETLRPGAAEAVAALRAQGLDVRLLSGDREAAVGRLAARVGIAHWQAGCSPEAKLSQLLALQREGRRVLMVGDGMNDGPVLARADVSVAMGQGVPLAQAQSDFIVQGGHLSALRHLLVQARRCRRTVRQNIAWAVVYNAACVPLAIAGFMPAWLAGLGMACSSLLVVGNAARLARVSTER
jgi:Cu2+-exporting ATPase